MLIALNDGILDCEKLDQREKMVLLAIARHINNGPEEIAYPSIRTVAHTACCSVGSTYKAIRSAIAKGALIQHEQGHQRRSTRYRFPEVMFKYGEHKSKKLCSTMVNKTESYVHPGMNAAFTLGEQSPPYSPPTREGELTAPPDREEEARKLIERLGGITRTKDKDLLPEWRAVMKRMKPSKIEALFQEAVPAIQWPSQFRDWRASKANY